MVRIFKWQTNWQNYRKLRISWKLDTLYYKKALYPSNLIYNLFINISV